MVCLDQSEPGPCDNDRDQQSAVSPHREVGGDRVEVIEVAICDVNMVGSFPENDQ